MVAIFCTQIGNKKKFQTLIPPMIVMLLGEPHKLDRSLARNDLDVPKHDSLSHTYINIYIYI